MMIRLDEMIDLAMKLPLEERAELAGMLLRSLDEPSEAEVERLWLEEAERRLAEYRCSKVRPVPADEVFNRPIADVS